MLNITLEPGEELCDCETCQRLAHEPMSLRIPRSRYHKILEGKVKDRARSPTTRATGDEASVPSSDADVA